MMNDLFAYLFELNVAFVILWTAYKLFFERDKNFVIRRIYLLGVVVLPFLLLLIPEGTRMSVHQMAPITISLEEVTIFGTGTAMEQSGNFSFRELISIIYMLILFVGLFKLIAQFATIFRAILGSERIDASGTTLLSNRALHASSFFGYIFIDPAALGEKSFQHILAHENIHKREWHSIDRILVELFVLINWFNPLAWMFRKSVIENLEYLADSAVLRRGTDPMKYQLSILNQYIGSASITNQFSSQIKNRINMLNRDYKLGSSWKLALILPLVFIAFLFVSCTDKNEQAGMVPDNQEEVAAEEPATSQPTPASLDGEVFYVVEKMPTFQGEDAGTTFRKYIAQNVRYPDEAKANGITGKIFIKFIVTSEGEVVVPDQAMLAEIEGKPLDEVVVVAYRTMNKDEALPDEKYIKMLQDEVIRVVESTPDWEPGMQRGIPVNVAFTFPVNFALQ